MKYKVYVLRNSRGNYATYDLYGWESSSAFFFAIKFCNRKEAKDAAKIVNYCTVSPNNDYQSVRKTVKVKSREV